jgi:hypothetical protein
LCFERYNINDVPSLFFLDEKRILILLLGTFKNKYMSYEIAGKLVAVFDIVQRTETFKTREFVIEKSEDIGGRVITNYVKFQCVQDKTAMVDRFNLGEEVKVQFNIKGTKWVKDGRENYITNLDAWRMETLKLDQGGNAGPSVNYNDMPPPVENVDDLPF